MALNKVILIGRLTADPELKSTQSGLTVTSFTVAVDRSYSKDGTKACDFINCTAWKQTAEFITRYFTKGSMIAVVGELQQRSFTTKEGEKRSVYEVVVNEATFCESKKQNEQTDTKNAVSQFSPTITGADFEEIGTEDALPF